MGTAMNTGMIDIKRQLCAVLAQVTRLSNHLGLYVNGDNFADLTQQLRERIEINVARAEEQEKVKC
jgi:hypothetical protein